MIDVIATMASSPSVETRRQAVLDGLVLVPDDEARTAAAAA